jgi:hypothetical protein
MKVAAFLLAADAMIFFEDAGDGVDGVWGGSLDRKFVSTIAEEETRRDCGVAVAEVGAVVRTQRTISLCVGAWGRGGHEIQSRWIWRCVLAVTCSDPRCSWRH